MKAKVDEVRVQEIVGVLQAPGGYKNGGILTGVCGEKEFVVGNSYFRKKEIEVYIWVSEISVIDYMLGRRVVKDRLLFLILFN